MQHRHSSAEGKATVKINGRSAARAEAHAYAQAYAAAIAESSVCGKCSAAATFVAESWEHIFLEAVAEAEVELSGETNGGSAEIRETTFVQAVEEATVIAYADVRTPDSMTTCMLSILNLFFSLDIVQEVLLCDRCAVAMWPLAVAVVHGHQA